MSSIRKFGWFSLALLTAGLARSQDDGLVVEGLRGTIPREAVSQVVQSRMADLIHCVEARESANEMVSGDVTLGFVIARNGTVSVARIAASTLGDRDAERCMTQIGSSLRFPPPTGGDADASESVRFPIDAEVRPPITWTADRVRTAVGPSLDRLADRCHVSGGSVRVTAYVGRGGRVMSVGGFANRRELDRAGGCVLDAVAGMTMPDPGSYPAKVTFDVGR